MDSSWITEFIQNGLDRWGTSLQEIWTLIGTSPQDFRGGSIWSVICGVNNVMKGFGFGLLVKGHDPAQRATGMLCLFGGILIAFSKEIIEVIAGVTIG